LNFIKNQKSNFTKEQEYGLLNRLDNATSGFLYFAKNKDFYDKFKKLQKEEKIEKVYYAKVT
jgi:23S rRNA-/tRNA-specific pseudouridylate synthase